MPRRFNSVVIRGQSVILDAPDIAINPQHISGSRWGLEPSAAERQGSRCTGRIACHPSTEVTGPCLTQPEAHSGLPLRPLAMHGGPQRSRHTQARIQHGFSTLFCRPRMAQIRCRWATTRVNRPISARDCLQLALSSTKSAQLVIESCGRAFSEVLGPSPSIAAAANMREAARGRAAGSKPGAPLWKAALRPISSASSALR
jgi:hypothetical protein